MSWPRRIMGVMAGASLWAGFVEYEASADHLVREVAGRVVSHHLHASHSTVGRGYDVVRYHPFARTTAAFELDGTKRSCVASYPGKAQPLEQPLQPPAAEWARLHPEGSAVRLLVHTRWVSVCQLVHGAPSEARAHIRSDVRAFLYAPAVLVAGVALTVSWAVTLYRGFKGKSKRGR